MTSMVLGTLIIHNVKCSGDKKKKTAPPQDTNYDAVLNPATAEGL